MTIRIAMWSGPRNISTAMMRSWGSRVDTFVCDEPFYANYLKVTNLDHPGLNKTPPDNQAAAGNVEGAIGTLEDAIKDDGLDPVQGEQLINQLLDVSRQIAVNAIDTANNTPGSDAGKISSANVALASGDSLRTPPTSFGDFKDAAAEYKTAIAEAEGALP